MATSTRKFLFNTGTGTLLFPPKTHFTNDHGSSVYDDPVEKLLETHATQLALLPDISEASTRIRATSTIGMDLVTALASSPDVVKRPNGEIYVPRKIKCGDLTLEDVATVRKCYEQRIPVLLYGPPGTGKTALAEAALEGVITLAGHGDTEFGDFEGSYVQNPDGTFTWVDGPWVVAMESGRPLFVDEIAMIDSKVLTGVYPSMDGRTEIHCRTNPARGKINIKDGFMVIGACNPDVPGSVMSEALLSRFLMHIEVLTDFDLAMKLGVPREIVVVARNLARKQKAGEIVKAPQMREMLAFRKIAETFGLHPALANFVGIAEPGDRDAFAEAVSSSFGKKIGALVIE